ncbi:hypothetical protein B0H10DRAFT_2429994 [Mycena sp. CBHHK59/15]|nr:hypothetical protein B0H10DRAFT_2429994 [Mycena sp. CBHHK59/15]
MRPTVPLSDSSGDDQAEPVLSTAEKARRTRALNLAKAKAADEKLMASTVGGRPAKHNALKEKIWGTRKRAPSTDEEPQRAKKAKAIDRMHDHDDAMDNAPAAPKKAPRPAAKKKAATASELATSKSSQAPVKDSESKANSKPKAPRAVIKDSSAGDNVQSAPKTRKYIPRRVDSPSDSEEPAIDNASQKAPPPALLVPVPKSKPKAAVGDDDTAGKPAINKAPQKAPPPALPVPIPKSKPKPAAGDDDDDMAGSPSPGDDETSDAARISEDDDGLTGDPEHVAEQLLSERPHIVSVKPKPAAQADDAGSDDAMSDFDPADLPSVFGHRRQSSSSSRASEYDLPVDTDFDMDTEDLVKDESESEAEVLARDMKRPQVRTALGLSTNHLPSSTSAQLKNTDTKKTAQQLKYDQEKPEIRATNVLHGPKTSKADKVPESAWKPSTRITYPSHGGLVKLLDQPPLLRSVIKGAMELSLYDLAFTDAYQPMASRSLFAQKLLREAAKGKGADGDPINKRAKRDLSFCRSLAPLVSALRVSVSKLTMRQICARTGNVRTDIRKSAISKVAAHYELNKAGTTPSQVRAIVKLLMKEQHYIFPYKPQELRPPNDVTTVTPNADTPAKAIKAFKTNAPFLAPIIPDIIHEIWFSTPKSFGFKHGADMKSSIADPDYANQKVLPDAMVCIVTTHVGAALSAWQTGVHVPAPEFSQGRLESTYKSHIETMQAQRTTEKSAKAFHKLMHELYLKASQSQPDLPVASSARNVITLDLDDD